MIYFKTPEEIERIRESSLLVSKTLAEVGRHIKPGLKTRELDKIAETVILDHGAKPGFKGYRGFPATLCMSPNEQVVHGFPNDLEIQDGDVLSIDCGVLMNGFYGDSAYTFAVGNVKPEVMHLLETTKRSLYAGIEKAVIGNRLGDISNAIQQVAERENGYGIVRELVGHGLGKNLHESPEVPNYGAKGRGVKLKRGLVIAIEPMVNLGKRHVLQADDGWTILTADRKPSAHFEHSVAIRSKEEGADILSSFSEIEEVEHQNGELAPVMLELNIENG